MVVLERFVAVISPAVDRNGDPEGPPEQIQLGDGPALVVAHHLIALESWHAAPTQAAGNLPFGVAAVPVAQLRQRHPDSRRAGPASAQPHLQIRGGQPAPEKVLEDLPDLVGGQFGREVDDGVGQAGDG